MAALGVVAARVERDAGAREEVVGEALEAAGGRALGVGLGEAWITSRRVKVELWRGEAVGAEHALRVRREGARCSRQR